MSMIPAFHPHAEALMSNLASRSHEWIDWEIEEVLMEFPTSVKSRGKRHQHYRILLKVKWVKSLHHELYVMTKKSSPSELLINRNASRKDSFRAARILSRRMKDSRGNFVTKEIALLDKFLT